MSKDHMTDSGLARALRDLSVAMEPVLADMQDVLEGRFPSDARERLGRTAPAAIQAARQVAVRSVDYRTLGLDAGVLADRLGEAADADWDDGGLFASVQGRFRPLRDAADTLAQDGFDDG